uniref:Uncharacterized protein n=1 Tax=Setaria viridis TaxID=4556 RepID=A0A4U6TJY6_SETVI|nr:hypothetical protein SEVIR_8G169150v2 [Setaria viridis]
MTYYLKGRLVSTEEGNLSRPSTSIGNARSNAEPSL